MEQPISPPRVLTTRRPSRQVIVVRHPTEIVGAQVRRLGKRVEAYIVKNPALGLGIALTFGVVLGWLIKRR